MTKMMVVVVLMMMQVRQFDEDKLECRIQKLRDSLFVNDPHLARLVTTQDCTAATDIQQDTDKQLLSVTPLIFL